MALASSLMAEIGNFIGKNLEAIKFEDTASYLMDNEVSLKLYSKIGHICHQIPFSNFSYWMPCIGHLPMELILTMVYIPKMSYLKGQNLRCNFVILEMGSQHSFFQDFLTFSNLQPGSPAEKTRVTRSSPQLQYVNQLGYVGMLFKIFKTNGKYFKSLI
jgi:hypothetical protein